MGRKILVINLLILAGVVLLSRYLTSEWRSFEEKNNVQRVLDKAEQNAAIVPNIESTPQPLPPQPYPDFTVIPEKDLFMADRRPPQPAQVQVVEPAPVFPKPPALNGVLNGNGKRQALMTIFDSPNAKGQSRVLSVGDMVNGWSIAEISETSLKLRWKDQEKVIDMFDSAPQQPSAAPQSQRAAVTVVTIGSSVAAVETVEASAAPGGEERPGGLVIGVAGGQGGQNTGQRGGQGGMGSSRGGSRNMGGVSSRSGRSGGQGGVQGGSGVMGMPGGASVPFSSGVRRNQ